MAGGVALAGCAGSNPPAGAVHSTGTIRGTLEVENGSAGPAQPTSGILILHNQGGQIRRLRTDTSGNFVADVRIGSYTFSATGPQVPPGATCRTPHHRVTVAADVTIHVVVSCSAS